MKKLLIPLIAVIFAFTPACDDVHPTYDLATITGYDLSLCACCGGYFIDIDNATYRFYTPPASSNIDLPSETFPIEVLVRWDPSATQCLGDEIDLHKLIKIP